MMQTRSKIVESGNKFQTNQNKSVNPGHHGEIHTVATNPFYIPEITEHMFQFLNLSDIKNCRLVSQKWNQLAENFLKKLSVVEMLEPECFPKFSKAFPNAQQTRIFTCFRLGHRYEQIKWPVYECLVFFEKWYHNLSELTLFGDDLGMYNETKTFDLSPFLPSTLNKLQIKSFNPRMIISSDKICNIRILELKNCILNLIPGTTLNNVEILLKNVKFRESEETDYFLINPWLNFDVLKKVNLGGPNIMLDLQGSQSLDMLSLDYHVTVLNYETSNWEITKLNLGPDYYNYLGEGLSNSQIKYKELETTLIHLDVSLLPEDIENLQVTLLADHHEKIPARISGEHNFLQMKHLHITLEWGDFSPFVEFFKHCPKLTILTMQLFDPGYDKTGKTFLKTSALPPSLKTLRVIQGIRIFVDRSLQLKSLILYDANHHVHYNDFVGIAKGLNVQNLYWCETYPKMKLGAYRNVSYNEERSIFKSLLDLNLEKFVVGEFAQVNNFKFEKSFLFPLVERQGEFYLFQRGGKGKAINGSDAKIYRNADENGSFEIINKQVESL